MPARPGCRFRISRQIQHVVSLVYFGHRPFETGVRVHFYVLSTDKVHSEPCFSVFLTPVFHIQSPKFVFVPVRESEAKTPTSCPTVVRSTD